MSLAVPSPPTDLFDATPWMRWRGRLVEMRRSAEDASTLQIIDMAIRDADRTIQIIGSEAAEAAGQHASVDELVAAG